MQPLELQKMNAEFLVGAKCKIKLSHKDTKQKIRINNRSKKKKHHKNAEIKTKENKTNKEKLNIKQTK